MAAVATGTEKPPYLVPSLAEIRARPRNGLTVASTFSGGGGSCTGYEMAGLEVVWANEFEPNAAQTYALNHPGTHLDSRSIRDVTGAEILAATGLAGVDVLDGSPPCQSFSMAGKRQKGWGEHHDHSDGTSQRSDDLFFEYSRLLGELRPRAFVAENVAGLVAGTAKGMFKEVMAALSAQGYEVRARLLDAQWLGVPQARRRVIILGVRSDLGLVPEFPSPLPYRYSILEACPWIADGGTELTVDPRSSTKGARGELRYPPTHRRLDEPATTVTTSSVHHMSVAFRQGGWKGLVGADLGAPAPTIQASQNRTEVGDLETHYGPRHKTRQPLDRPAPTVMASGINGRREYQASVPGDETAGDPETGETLRPTGHDAGRRRLTIGEVKRLCSFPDDYVLIGGYVQRWARLGNSVPPVMMSHVARVLAAQLLAHDASG